MVAVSGEDHMAFLLQQAVVRQHGKGQHHLVHLGLAVAPHAEYLVFHRGEQGNDLLGVIALGQIVAGAVIEQVSQQKQPVCPFPL